MSSSLAGKRVVIIGGATGLGYAVAEAVLADGAAVIVASSQEAIVQAAVQRLGDGATGVVVDVREEANIAAFFEGVGAFDHLVFTAGDWAGGFGGPVRDLDLTATQAGLTVRFWGALLAVKYGCRSIAQDGSITLTGGMLAHRPMKGAPIATAMGGAIEHLALGLAVDLAPVRVNAVCPGLILTEHTTQMIPTQMIQGMTASLPLPRGGDPAETAQAYLYLMRAGYTTGQTVRVDGGGSAV